MATIMFRNRFSAEGIRGFTTGKFNGKEREEMNRTAFRAIGLEIKQMYFSASDTCAVAIAEGDPDKIPLAEAWAMSTGAFLSVKADVLTPLAEFVEATKTLTKVYDLYEAPNQDEIDRMLLDE